MNIILGSGLNAFLARHILGSDYKMISAGPSRFYGVNPSAADNFIYSSDLLKPLENQLKTLGIDTKKYPYKCCWSHEGQLVRGFDKEHCYKTAQVAENKYIFYFLDRIDNPGLYLTPYIESFDLISGFFFPNCLPAGAISDTHWLRSYGITPLGMSAQWDAAMDISSCLHRLLKIADGSIE
jgi:hypothetical protein